jgi:RIO kinase 1
VPQHTSSSQVLTLDGGADAVEPGPDQRWSTWPTIAKGLRGPEPRPGWVVTAAAALDTELGVLKTGKEADVFLVERAVPDDPDRAVLLAAKRYRDTDHRQFHRSSAYTEGRRERRSRDQRATQDRTSAWGRSVRATQWADAEFATLCALWDAGAPVPYPVQIDGTELLLEFMGQVADDGTAVAAPRLAQARPAPDLLADWYEQIRTAMGVLARLGWAHGDLSPYNVLVDGDRLVVIDLPQVVDLAGNPQGFDFLLRDCTNVCDWFRRRGLDVDAGELFADLMAHAF